MFLKENMVYIIALITTFIVITTAIVYIVNSICNTLNYIKKEKYLKSIGFEKNSRNEYVLNNIKIDHDNLNIISYKNLKEIYKGD